MKMPDFIIMGAAKSGTTTLHRYLLCHPQVYMSSPKEPDFFSIDENYAQGLDYYQSLFTNAQPEQVCGEASTTYSRLQQHPHTVARIAETLPNVKLIYIMRHPVDRAYSFYIHRFKAARHKPEFAVASSFEETIKENSEFLDSSNYIFQIEQYLELFPRESFLFLLLEDLKEKPRETLAKICEFIGVDDQFDLVGEDQIIANKAKDYPDWFVRNQLTTPLKAIPGVALVKDLLPKELRDRAYKTLKSWRYKSWLEQQYSPPLMLPETRKTLIEKFKKPNQQLELLIDRDLSHWSK